MLLKVLSKKRTISLPTFQHALINNGRKVVLEIRTGEGMSFMLAMGLPDGYLGFLSLNAYLTTAEY